MSKSQGNMGLNQKIRSSLPVSWRKLYLCLAILTLLGVRAGMAGQGALCFFTNVADRMIRQSTTQWCAYNFNGYTNTYGGITNSFSITNIPVLVNGRFVYSPAVNRLLQLAANVYEATTNTFYPSVYRPEFLRDASGNIFIRGFQQVASVMGTSDPQLSQPIEVGALPPGLSTNVNVFGVPWILGAKKYMPNFNQFYMENLVRVSRLLQVTRPQVEGWNRPNAKDFATNELFVMSITNNVGFSFWNPYTTNYPGGALTVVVKDLMDMTLSNALAVIPGNFIAFEFETNLTVWPGSQWDLNIDPNSRQAAANSFIYGQFSYAFLPQSAYQFETGTFVPPATFDTSIMSLPLLPQFQLMTTNLIYAYILDGGHVIDYVSFNGPDGVRDLNSELYDFYTNSPSQMWVTNSIKQSTERRTKSGYFEPNICFSEWPRSCAYGEWLQLASARKYASGPAEQSPSGS